MGLFNDIGESTQDPTSVNKIGFDLVLSEYVKESQLQNYYKKGVDLDLSGNKITNIGNPTSPEDVTSKRFVQRRITNQLGPIKNDITEMKGIHNDDKIKMEGNINIISRNLNDLKADITTAETNLTKLREHTKIAVSTARQQIQTEIETLKQRDGIQSTLVQTLGQRINGIQSTLNTLKLTVNDIDTSNQQVQSTVSNLKQSHSTIVSNINTINDEITNLKTKINTSRIDMISYTRRLIDDNLYRFPLFELIYNNGFPSHVKVYDDNDSRINCTPQVCLSTSSVAITRTDLFNDFLEFGDFNNDHYLFKTKRPGKYIIDVNIRDVTDSAGVIRGLRFQRKTSSDIYLPDKNIAVDSNGNSTEKFCVYIDADVEINLFFYSDNPTVAELRGGSGSFIKVTYA